MALTDENSSMGTTMLVQPSGMNGNGGFGDWGGSGFWIILLFILLGGWGNGFGNGFGGGMNDLYPWMNNSQNINNGFRDQMINDNVTSIRDGVYGIQNQLCSGFAGTTAAVTGAQNAVSQQLYNNEIASLNRSFAEQTANMQGFNGVQAQLAQCCCDNRAAVADTKFTIATEACATRQANNDNTQKILDKLCQLELDGVRRELSAEQRENANLRSDLMYARGQASQVEQTAALRASQATTANQLVAELRSCPIPAQPVYGNQPIFQCAGPVFGNNGGCGCAGNAFAN